MNNWLKELVHKTNEIIYSQWAALGANVAAPACWRAVVDPEALVVATCAFGRYDARIFDEAMDWTAANRGRLKPTRLKTISEEFGGDTLRCVGAMFDFLGERGERKRFSKLVEIAGEAKGEEAAQTLFFNDRHSYETDKNKAEPTFKSWGFLRGDPRLRAHSERPDLNRTANLMLKMRVKYGSDARGDVMTYLVSERGGNSRAIAAKIKYSQPAVHAALNRLVEDGIVQKKGRRGNADYWIDIHSVRDSLGIRDEGPVFFVWADYFKALHMVAEDIRANTEKWSSPFFSAESSRRLTVDVAPLIRKSGGPLEQIRLPDLSAMKGAGHNEELHAFLDKALVITADYVFESEA